MTARRGWNAVAGLMLGAMACAQPDVPANNVSAAGIVVDSMAPIPDGPLGDAIRRGRAILLATSDSLPDHVGNALRCTSCHLNEGRRHDAMPWTGVAARFPQYRSRSAAVIRLEDRINDCFERSLAGKAVPWDDPAMRDMVAYMTHLSTGIRVGDTVPGQGLPKGSAVPGDSLRGAERYAQECARCHGGNGEGTPGFPPLWGERSYSIGAGMARLRTVAAFMKHNMPFDRPGTLNDQDAQDIATFLTTRPRPDFARKAEDWPNGDAPPDVAYPTRANPRPTP